MKNLLRKAKRHFEKKKAVAKFRWEHRHAMRTFKYSPLDGKKFEWRIYTDELGPFDPRTGIGTMRIRCEIRVVSYSGYDYYYDPDKKVVLSRYGYNSAYKEILLPG